MQKYYYETIKVLISICYIVIIISVFLGVVFRYAPFLPSLFWAEEVARYMFIWMVFIASSIALRRGAHLGVELLRDMLPSAAKRYIIIVTNSAIIVFLSFIVYYGFMAVNINFSQVTPNLRIPTAYPYLAIPIGSLLMIIELGISTFRVVKKEVVL